MTDEARSEPLADQEVVVLLGTDYSRCPLVIELLGAKRDEGWPSPASLLLENSLFHLFHPLKPGNVDLTGW